MNQKTVMALLALGIVVALFFRVFTGGAPTKPQTEATASTNRAGATNPKEKSMVEVYNKEGQLVSTELKRVVKTDAEWKAQLTPAQFQIARKQGTERPFCGNLLDNKKNGTYVCICCGLPLFSSSGKFESGTGWPSFFQPVAEGNVLTHNDVSFGMVRKEILCARCDCHLGHVFDDGPAPTRLRFCVNSESLKFVDEAALSTLAER